MHGVRYESHEAGDTGKPVFVADDLGRPLPDYLEEIIMDDVMGVR